MAQAKKEKEDLLSDYATLEKTKQLLKALDGSSAASDLKKCLDIIIRTCSCYTTSPEIKEVREITSQKESQLEMARNRMKLGYTTPGDEGKFVEMSSVGLRNVMSTNSDEATRKAAYEGLRTIGPFVCENGFVEIIKLRNKLAKSLGFEDYYDYKVTNAEGMSKKKLFEILDGLEEGTRPIMEKSQKVLVERHGSDATNPWNTTFMLSGSVMEKMEYVCHIVLESPERYVSCYAKLGITYEGSVMNLDLLERKNKYCKMMKKLELRMNLVFTLAFTDLVSFIFTTSEWAVGSGHRALTTLMHEAGHAAHFANIKQPSPLFGQEHPPFSAALAEGQSMFLDALVDDAAWRAKYALDTNGNPIPFELIEEEIKATHPFKVRSLRAMLSVPYFEKALYELADDEVTVDRIQQLADDVEKKIQGSLVSCSLILNFLLLLFHPPDRLAEMCVHQTRAFVLDRDGYIVDNPKVGPTLANAYWKYGNERPFLELIQELTGKELSGEAWVSALQIGTEEHLQEERNEYDKSVREMQKKRDATGESKQDTAGEAEPDLNMTIRFVDGDELIADSSNGGLLKACKDFESYVLQK
ncbi:MAG: hypothetical protein SGILL_007357 [Bacillariaceae sp.]